MSDLDSLFEPLTIRGMTMTNRIVMAPMTSSLSPDGIPGEDVA
ncbi:MAG: 12-oxophytodienoate reductase, partial [Gammaproteobacteria bacterium]|nr:12-oxophytodienoate reductase [Gammaproteobacteria bacterium]